MYAGIRMTIQLRTLTRRVERIGLVSRLDGALLRREDRRLIGKRMSRLKWTLRRGINRSITTCVPCLEEQQISFCSKVALD